MFEIIFLNWYQENSKKTFNHKYIDSFKINIMTYFSHPTLIILCFLYPILQFFWYELLFQWPNHFYDRREKLDTSGYLLHQVPAVGCVAAGSNDRDRTRWAWCSGCCRCCRQPQSRPMRCSLALMCTIAVF